MSEAMNSLVTGLKETTDFAHEMGRAILIMNINH